MTAVSPPHMSSILVPAACYALKFPRLISTCILLWGMLVAQQITGDNLTPSNLQYSKKSLNIRQRMPCGSLCLPKSTAEAGWQPEAYDIMSANNKHHPLSSFVCLFAGLLLSFFLSLFSFVFVRFAPLYIGYIYRCHPSREAYWSFKRLRPVGFSLFAGPCSCAWCIFCMVCASTEIH